MLAGWEISVFPKNIVETRDVLRVLSRGKESDQFLEMAEAVTRGVV